jgi:hypothetical protein
VHSDFQRNTYGTSGFKSRNCKELEAAVGAILKHGTECSDGSLAGDKPLDCYGLFSVLGEPLSFGEESALPSPGARRQPTNGE